MIFDFLFKKTGKDIDENKYFNYDLNEQQIAILQSEEHKEFKDVMLDVMEKKIAENINALIHNHDDQKDELYKAVVLVYEDWIDYFLTAKVVDPKKRFDPLNKTPVR